MLSLIRLSLQLEDDSIYGGFDICRTISTFFATYVTRRNLRYRCQSALEKAVGEIRSRRSILGNIMWYWLQDEEKHE